MTHAMLMTQRSFVIVDTHVKQIYNSQNYSTAPRTDTLTLMEYAGNLQ